MTYDIYRQDVSSGDDGPQPRDGWKPFAAQYHDANHTEYVWWRRMDRSARVIRERDEARAGSSVRAAAIESALIEYVVADECRTATGADGVCRCRYCRSMASLRVG